MQVTAVLRGVHLSPQKARLVADLVRGKKSRPSFEHPGIHT